VAANLAWLVGPTVGGFLADRSSFVLFVLDAAISLVTAGIVYFFLPETYTKHSTQTQGKGPLHTLGGYGRVTSDGAFVPFCAASLLLWGAYQQVYTSLAVFLRDFRGVSAQGYGLLVTINAMIVVFLQMWLTSKIRSRPPALMMAVGALIYCFGLGAFGWPVPFSVMVGIMILVTVGEMIVAPVSQALVALLAPEEMRGRYAAFFGLAVTVPAIIGPWAGGLLMDGSNPDWLWFASGLVCAAAALSFFALHLTSHGRLGAPPAPTA
jgi:MFS family permease